MAGEPIAITSFVPVAAGAASPGATLPADAGLDFRSLIDERLLALLGAAETPTATRPESGEPSARDTQDSMPALSTAEAPTALPINPFVPVSIPASVPAPTPTPGVDATSAAAPSAAATPLARDMRATTLPEAQAMQGSEPAVPFAAPAAAATTEADAYALAPAALPDLPLPATRPSEHEAQRGAATLFASAPGPAAPAVSAPALPAPAPQQLAHASVTVPESVMSPHWADAVGERLVFVARDGASSAELHVHPAELGPISVRIDVRGDQASVVFGAAHADARNALEAALPRLVESFAAQGLALANAHVGAQLARDGGAQGFASPAPDRDSAGAGDLGAERIREITRRALGIVDTFA